MTDTPTSEKNNDFDRFASRPPRIHWKEIAKYPVISGIGLLAIGMTIAWWSHADLSIFFESAEIRRGQLWRLVTSVFPHLDIFHLGFNLYWLGALGTTVERVYGHLRTVVLVLVLAIGSSSFDFAFASGGVGLSGVGYGLLGLLYVLAQHDERFKGSLDKKTVNLFIGWFFFCLLMTLAHLWSVANIAHASGAALGLLLGYGIVVAARRRLVLVSVAGLIVLGLVGATIVRPFINLSAHGGYEEGKWGYDALLANRNREALRWLRDAVRYQPRIPSYWFNLGIAYQRLQDQSAAAAAYQRAYQLQPTDPDYAGAAGKKTETK